VVREPCFHPFWVIVLEHLIADWSSDKVPTVKGFLATARPCRMCDQVWIDPC